jgi:hypothetical protein
LSIAATKWVIEKRGIPLPTRAVLIVIADMVNRSGEAWPSLNTIADKCEIKKRMVINHLAKAVSLGVITVNKTPGKGSTYSFPTGAIKYTTPLYTDSNRNGTVNNNNKHEDEEKKEIPDWAEIVNQTAEFCGGQPLTQQHIGNIEERAKSLDLKHEALAFEDHHITSHRKSKYKSFATYSRFSSTWLTNSLERPTNGFNSKRTKQTAPDPRDIVPGLTPSGLL